MYRVLTDRLRCTGKDRVGTSVCCSEGGVKYVTPSVSPGGSKFLSPVPEMEKHLTNSSLNTCIKFR